LIVRTKIFTRFTRKTGLFYLGNRENLNKKVAIQKVPFTAEDAKKSQRTQSFDIEYQYFAFLAVEKITFQTPSLLIR